MYLDFLKYLLQITHLHDDFVTIKNKQFDISRIILAASCEYFYDIYKIPTTEGLVRINDLEEDFRVFLEYLYNWDVFKVTNQNIENILNFNSLLNINQINELVNEYVSNDLSLTQNAEDGDISKVGLDTFDTFPLATLETVFCKERICKMSQEDAFTIFKNWMAYDFEARKDKWLDLVDLINLIGGSKRKRAVIGYDFTTNEVNLFSDMTIDMFDHAAENIEQTIFIFGGPNELRNLDNIFTFDTSTFQFKRSALKLNKSRHSFGSCAFDKNIYIMGERYDGSVSNVVEIFDVEKQTSINCKPMPIKEIEFSCINIGHSIYISQGGIKSECFRYDPREGICHSLEKMLCGRQRSAYTKLNNQIYAFGGWHCIARNEATVYDTRNDSWLKLAPLKTSLCLIKATEFRNKLYLFGGVVPNDSSSKDVNIYTPATGNWTMSTKKLPYYMDSYAMATH